MVRQCISGRGDMDMLYKDTSYFTEQSFNELYISLGRRCNLNCYYCKQQLERKKDDLQDHFTPEVREKVKEIIISYNPDIAISAGEPLLYIDQIKDIIHLVREEAGSHQPIVIYTNGRLLTEELIEYFNHYNVSLNVSYDGVNSEINRGYNVYRDKKNILYKINFMSFFAVLTSHSYPETDVINSVKEYYRLAKVLNPNSKIRVVEEPLLPVEGKYPEGFIPDYDRVREEMTSICSKAENFLMGNTDYQIYFDFISTFLFRYDNRGSYSCGMGSTMLSIDLAGNALTCPSLKDNVGNILTETVETLLAKTLAVGVPIEKAKEMCQGCIAEYYCYYGCRLIESKEEREHYCKSYQALIEPVVNLRERLVEKGLWDKVMEKFNG